MDYNKNLVRCIDCKNCDYKHSECIKDNMQLTYDELYGYARCECFEDVSQVVFNSNIIFIESDESNKEMLKHCIELYLHTPNIDKESDLIKKLIEIVEMIN